MSQRSLRCLVLRGGTSRGPYFEPHDLPADPALRDRVLLAVMGSPDLRQIDGLGGADTLTSKVAIVGRSQRPGIDVDYLFAQVAIDRALVDTGPSCGNMLAGVAPFAIERGLVTPGHDTTTVMIFNENTGSRIEAVVQTPRGILRYDGEQRIDGVPGTAAPILLNFMDVVGSKCGSLLPTGALREQIEGVTVSCIDVAMPMVLMRATDLGLTGYETDALMADQALRQRIERIRLEAGRRMGLGDVRDSVMPKVGLLAPPRQGGTLSSRYLTPHHLHAAHAVTGAICVATCAVLEGSAADGIARRSNGTSQLLRIEHPSGHIDLALEISGRGAALRVLRAGLVRTARKIMDGRVFIPAHIWP